VSWAKWTAQRGSIDEKPDIHRAVEGSWNEDVAAAIMVVAKASGESIAASQAGMGCSSLKIMLP